MAEILLRAEEARGAAGDMRTRANNARQEFDSTRSRLNELASSFKGQAATSFDAKFEEWRTGANQVLEALNGLSEFLTNAANTIEQTDAQIANQLRGG